MIKPKKVNKAEMIFGGNLASLLPPYHAIPDEFKDCDQYSGLDKYPTAKEGINIDDAMKHLAAIQGSFEPKHEHKQAGVAYLASLWFVTPDIEEQK